MVRQGRLSKIVLVVAVIGLAVFAIGELAGGSDDEVDVAVEETTTTSATSDDPLACLDDLGLSNIEKRSDDLWRAFYSPPWAPSTGSA
ncbi:MAG: hypothetical protein KatS3mg012_1818 [Gaiellaceae bacterium]|jgi:hypothetical protein|nr:MAG: hypothetical protein KatS3mg012_1818 [Gaiellaceae bacterium]